MQRFQRLTLIATPVRTRIAVYVLNGFADQWKWCETKNLWAYSLNFIMPFINPLCLGKINENNICGTFLKWMKFSICAGPVPLLSEPFRLWQLWFPKAKYKSREPVLTSLPLFFIEDPPTHTYFHHLVLWNSCRILKDFIWLITLTCGLIPAVEI